MKITTEKLVALLGERGPMSRAAIQYFFNVTQAYASHRIAYAMATREVYIESWRREEGRGSGGGVPHYAKRTSPDQVDAVRTFSERKGAVRQRQVNRQRVTHAKGVDPQHAQQAADSSAEFGVWGGLVR